jgi:CBS domain-containing protein
MATISSLLNDRTLFIVSGEQSVLEAARAMTALNIGAVPVSQDGRLIGIFSERDMMRRVICGGLDPATTRVVDVMTPDPCAVGPNDTIDKCMFLMKQHGFRHLPVCVDDDCVIGFISLRDLLLHDLDEKEVEVRMMRAYLAAGAE